MSWHLRLSIRIIFPHVKNFSLKVYLKPIKKNIQILAIDMYKTLNGSSPDFMQDIFETKNNYYNTRNAPAFSSRNIKTIRYRLQTISCMNPKILGLDPKEMKQATTLNEFKSKIKIAKLENCTCQLCRTYLTQIGFITECLLT